MYYNFSWKFFLWSRLKIRGETRIWKLWIWASIGSSVNWGHNLGFKKTADVRKCALYTFPYVSKGLFLALPRGETVRWNCEQQTRKSVLILPSSVESIIDRGRHPGEPEGTKAGTGGRQGEGEASPYNLRKRASEWEGSKMKGEECNYYNSDLLHHLKKTSIWTPVQAAITWKINVIRIS